MSDFFTNLNPWAKGAIIVLGIVLLFLIFNYEPASRMPEVSKIADYDPEYSFEDEEVYENVEEKVGAVESVTAETAPQEKETEMIAEGTKMAERPTVSPAKEEPQAEEKTPMTEFYSVQIASLKEEERAKNLASKIGETGYSVEVVVQDIGGKGTWHRVYVGRYASKKEAEKILSRIRADYKDAFIKMRGP